MGNEKKSSVQFPNHSQRKRNLWMPFYKQNHSSEGQYNGSPIKRCD